MSKSPKTYGKTFLTKPRKSTRDYFVTVESRYVWGHRGKGVYTLSYLGVINGLLKWVGLALAAEVVGKGDTIVGHKLIRR